MLSSKWFISLAFVCHLAWEVADSGAEMHAHPLRCLQCYLFAIPSVASACAIDKLL